MSQTLLSKVEKGDLETGAKQSYLLKKIPESQRRGLKRLAGNKVRGNKLGLWFSRRMLAERA